MALFWCDFDDEINILPSSEKKIWAKVWQAVSWFWCNVRTYAAHRAQCYCWLCKLIDQQSFCCWYSLLYSISRSHFFDVYFSDIILLQSSTSTFCTARHFDRWHIAKPSLVCRWTALTASVVPAGVSKHGYLTIFCMRFCSISPVFGWACMRQTTPCIVFGRWFFSLSLVFGSFVLFEVAAFACVFEFYTFNIPTQNKTIKPTNAGSIFPYTQTRYYHFTFDTQTVNIQFVVFRTIYTFNVDDGRLCAVSLSLSLHFSSLHLHFIQSLCR